MRHADAESTAVTGCRDFDRPLSEQGRSDALRQSDWLREFHLVPDRVMCSPALRTLQTAGIVCEHLGFDPRRIDQQRAIYEASISDLIRLLEEKPGDRVLVVGHNPAIAGLAGFTVGAHVMLSPGSVAWITFDEPPQGPIQPAEGHLHAQHHVRQS